MSPKTMTATSETDAVKARMRTSGWTSKCMAEVEWDIMFATTLLPPKSHHYGETTAPCRQQHAFRKQLAKNPRPPSTECKSHCYFALARVAACEQQVRHICASDEQEHSNYRHQKRQGL